MTTVTSPDAPLDLWGLTHARSATSTLAANKRKRKKFVRMIIRLWANQADERTVSVPYGASFARSYRPCRRELRRCRPRSARDAAACSSPKLKSATAIRHLIQCANRTTRAEQRNAKHAVDWSDRSRLAVARTE